MGPPDAAYRLLARLAFFEAVRSERPFELIPFRL